MTGPLDNYTTTGANHPDTSQAAAEMVRPRTGTGRYRVLAALAMADLTDEEMQGLLDMAPNTQRPRRVELVRVGLVVDTGRRRITTTGTRSIVWAATPAGRALLRSDP